MSKTAVAVQLRCGCGGCNASLGSITGDGRVFFPRGGPMRGSRVTPDGYVVTDAKGRSIEFLEVAGAAEKGGPCDRVRFICPRGHRPEARLDRLQQRAATALAAGWRRLVVA